jgi:hypothetical protein
VDLENRLAYINVKTLEPGASVTKTTKALLKVLSENLKLQSELSHRAV